MDRVSRHPLVGIELGTSMMVTISRIALKILPCMLSNANWRDTQSSKPPPAWLQRVHLATLASDILAGILADPPHFSAGIQKKTHPPLSWPLWSSDFVTAEISWLAQPLQVVTFPTASADCTISSLT